MSRSFGKLCEKGMQNKSKQNSKKATLEEIFADEKQITETLQRAVKEAVLAHKRVGNPIAIWKNGKAVWIETSKS